MSEKLDSRFWLWHGVLPFGIFAVLAWLFAATDWDLRLAVRSVSRSAGAGLDLQARLVGQWPDPHRGEISGPADRNFGPADLCRFFCSPGMAAVA
jgi:hypothetical protein